MADEPSLRAPLVIEYPFTRTTGPVVGAFLTALREGFVVGIRASDGRVLVPPTEFDPLTNEPLTDIVEVASEGEVTSWSWAERAVPAPVRGPDEDLPWDASVDDQPLSVPFAWVLVRLDGADTSLLHALDVHDMADVHTGLRVRIRWRAEREGSIRDIACFEPLAESGGAA